MQIQLRLRSRCISHDVNVNSDVSAHFAGLKVHRAPSPRISQAVDAGERLSRDGGAATCPGSPATNLLVGRNSTVIPNNYLQLGREAKAFLHTRVCARRLLSGYTWPAGEGPAEFGPACISPAGRSALIRHHSLAHRHVHASLSVQSSSEISVIPSNDFSPFVLRGRARGSTHAPGGTRWPGQNLSFRPLSSRLVDDYILRESLSIIIARKILPVCKFVCNTRLCLESQVETRFSYIKKTASLNCDVHWITFETFISFEGLIHDWVGNIMSTSHETRKELGCEWF